MRRKFDLSAYLVIGPENTDGRSVARVIAEAVRAGFTFVQIRAKNAEAREIIELTRAAADVIAAQGKSAEVALVINDRMDCVLAAREQGIKAYMLGRAIFRPMFAANTSARMPSSDSLHAQQTCSTMCHTVMPRASTTSGQDRSTQRRQSPRQDEPPRGRS